jgi:hypothetical protein
VTRKYEVLLEEYNGNIDAANNALTQLTDLEATREHAQTTQEALMDLQDKFLVVSDAKNNLETKCVARSHPPQSPARNVNRGTHGAPRL